MKTLTLALLLAFAMPALAQNEENAQTEKKAGWDGTGELGYVSSSGNSRSDSINAKLGFTYEDEEWKHQFGLAGYRQRGEVVVLTDPDDPSSGVERMQLSANRYELSGSTARKLDERNRLYTSLRYENDDFAAYEYQGTLSVGWGHQLVENDRTKVYFEIGPGYRRSKSAVTDEIESGFIGRGLVNYEQALTANTTLLDTFLVEAGSDNTFLQNDLGVKVAMNEKLAIKAGLQHRHNTDVEPGIKKTDRLTTVNLVYDF